MEYTAKRITKGSKHEIQILDETGAVVASAGGARATRANAVIFTKWARNDEAGIFGLRADIFAAQAEAERMMSPTRRVPTGYRQTKLVERMTPEWVEVLRVSEVAV